MTLNVVNARAYVGDLDLRGTPLTIVEQGVEDTAGEIFATTKNQAQIVGAGLFSFTSGVDAMMREAISSSALLAQLVANKKTSSSDKPLEWFAEYTTVLQNIGWVIQDVQLTDYTADGTAADVNEKIIEVMTVALGPSAAAAAILVATVKALKGMQPDSSWFRIFERESQRARIARFQIGLVEEEADKKVFVSLLSCLIEARNDIVQVLFFRFKNAQATFKANSQRASIDTSLMDLKDQIDKKIRVYQQGYLSSIVDL